MAYPNPTVQAVVAATRRRAWARDALRYTLVGVAVGGAAAVLWAAGSRRFVALPHLGWPSLSALVGAGAVLVGLVAATARRWSLHQAATRVDQAFGLHDRLSTSMAMVRSTDPIAALVHADAEAAAKSARPPVRIRDGVTWRELAAVLAAVLAGVVVDRYVAPAAPVSPTVSRAKPVTPETASQVREMVRETDPVVRDREAAIEHEAAVAALERELQSGVLDDAQARAKAAAIAERAAERLEADAAETRAASDAARRDLAAAARRAGSHPGSPAEQLAQALGREDAVRAAQAARELAERLPRMSPGEREVLERDLRALEEAMAPPAPDTTAEPRPDMPADEHRSDGGATPMQAARSNDQPTTPPTRIEEGPPSTPASGEESPPDAQQPTDGVASNPTKSHDTRDALREALREAREQVRQPPKPPGETPAESTLPPEQQNNSSRDERGEMDAASGTSTPPKDGEPATLPREGPSRNPDPSSAAPPERRPGDTSPSSETGSGTSQSQSDARDEARSTRPESTPRPSDSTPSPGTSPTGQGERDAARDADGTRTTPDVPPAGTSPTQTREEEGRSSSPPVPDGGERPRPGFERLADELRKLAERERLAERSAEDARRLRDRAKRLLEELNPAERQELERLARELGQGQPRENEPPSASDEFMPGTPLDDRTETERPDLGATTPTDRGEQPGRVTDRRGTIRPELTRREGDQHGTGGEAEGESNAPRTPPSDGRTGPGEAARVPADARGGQERAIAELAPDGLPAAPGDARPALAPALRRAAQSAQRDIEQRAVPPQYADLVRRVFRRYVDRPVSTPN